jgi:hypothetical protein
MGRDGGFHPFKGRVSRHFGDSVRLYLCPACSKSTAYSTHTSTLILSSRGYNGSACVVATARGDVEPVEEMANEESCGTVGTR